MFEYFLYGLGFFIITLILQFVLHKFRKNQNKGTGSIWTGTQAIVIIAAIGIINGQIQYLAAIIGFAIADEAGKSFGWH